MNHSNTWRNSESAAKNRTNSSKTIGVSRLVELSRGSVSPAPVTSSKSAHARSAEIGLAPSSPTPPVSASSHTDCSIISNSLKLKRPRDERSAASVGSLPAASTDGSSADGVATGSAGATQLDATVNYADLQGAVDAVLLESEQPYRLLEAMVDAILDRLMATPGVSKATVRIAKPEAPLPHPGGCPWVEASRVAEAEP